MYWSVRTAAFIHQIEPSTLRPPLIMLIGFAPQVSGFTPCDTKSRGSEAG